MNNTSKNTSNNTLTNTCTNAVTYRPARARNRDRTDDLILTKDVLYRLSYACNATAFHIPQQRPAVPLVPLVQLVQPTLAAHRVVGPLVSPCCNDLRTAERETGLEPATSSLEGLRSTS